MKKLIKCRFEVDGCFFKYVNLERIPSALGLPVKEYKEEHSFGSSGDAGLKDYYLSFIRDGFSDIDGCPLFRFVGVSK